MWDEVIIKIIIIISGPLGSPRFWRVMKIPSFAFMSSCLQNT